MAEAPKFGTSGLRGLATALTDELCAAYAQAFTEMSGARRVLIGRDLRDSSPRIQAAVAAGVHRGGAEAVDCGVLPTPALALAAGAEEAAAIMVTGSHIPGDRNGLKFYRGADEIGKDDEAPLHARVAEIGAAPLGGVPEMDVLDAAEAFVERYLAFFGLGALSGLNVGVWEHSSVARDLLPAILEGLGARVVRLDRSETFVAVDTEAVAGEVRERLGGWTREHGLDAVVSTDGDADRPLLTDETGAMVQGDILGTITSRLLEVEAVATPVSSNTMIDRIGLDRVVRTKIGSPYVIEVMEALCGEGLRRVAGFEPNGGYLLGFEAERQGRRLSALLTRDFALPILAALVDARERGGSVSALVADLPDRRTATDRLQDIPVERSRALVNEVLTGDSSVLPDALGGPVQIDTTDGARLTFAGGEIVTIRPSGNAPELRAYVEADGMARASALLSDVLARLRDRLG